MSKSLSGSAGSEAAMIMFRGICESSFYDDVDRPIAVNVIFRDYYNPCRKHFRASPIVDHSTISKPKKVGNYGQRQSHNNEENCIRHKVREGHESNSAEQRNKSLLFLSVNKVGKTDRTENHSPK
jgi:hypothetical protein